MNILSVFPSTEKFDDTNVKITPDQLVALPDFSNALSNNMISISDIEFISMKHHLDYLTYKEVCDRQTTDPKTSIPEMTTLSVNTRNLLYHQVCGNQSQIFIKEITTDSNYYDQMEIFKVTGENCENYFLVNDGADMKGHIEELDNGVTKISFINRV